MDASNDRERRFRATLMMVTGAVLWASTLVFLLFSKRLGVDPASGSSVVMFGGWMVFLVGFHRVLWAGPRAEPGIPRLARWVISFGASLAFQIALLTVAGLSGRGVLWFLHRGRA